MKDLSSKAGRDRVRFRTWAQLEAET